MNRACEKVAEEKFPFVQADFRVARTNVRAAKPELTVAINANEGLGMPATIRQARQSSLPGKLVAAVGRVAPSGFYPQGLSGLARPLVAERLGATKGRTHHHDRSKANRYFDVQVAAMVRVTPRPSSRSRRHAGAVERLSAMALRHAQILLTELPMQKVAVQGLKRQLLVSTLASHSPVAKRLRAVVKMRDDYESLFAEVIDQGIREGLLIDLPPRLATKPIFGVLNWATVWYSPRRLQSPATIHELAQLLAAYAMRGLLKPAAG